MVKKKREVCDKGKVKGKIAHLVETEIELQATVPTKSLKKDSEHGLRELSVKQDTEFGFERHFNKDRIDKSKIDMSFGFGRIALKKEDLQEALKRAKDMLE